MEAVGEGIQVGEAGRYAGEDAAAAADRLDLVQGAWHDLGQGVIVLGGAAVGDRVHLGLGTVDKFVGVGVTRVTKLHDPGAGLDQAAQDCPLADDAGIETGVGRGGYRSDQGVQVGAITDPGDVAALGELVSHRDGVHRLTTAVHVEDRLVDDLMRGPVVVLRADRLDHVRDRVLRQQHPAEHTLLGRYVVRRSPLEIIAP